MQSLTSKFVLLLSAMLFAPRVAAAERVTLLLNWYSTADHSPYYFVKRHGLHGKIGLDVIIESGEVGSSGAARWRPQCGIRRRRCSDSSRSQEQRGQFMVVYANSPQGFHWLKSSGLGCRNLAQKVLILRRVFRILH